MLEILSTRNYVLTPRKDKEIYGRESCTLIFFPWAWVLLNRINWVELESASRETISHPDLIITFLVSWTSHPTSVKFNYLIFQTSKMHFISITHFTDMSKLINIQIFGKWCQSTVNEEKTFLYHCVLLAGFIFYFFNFFSFFFKFYFIFRLYITVLVY